MQSDQANKAEYRVITHPRPTAAPIAAIWLVPPVLLFNQTSEYSFDHSRILYTGDDFDITTALTAGFNINTEYAF